MKKTKKFKENRPEITMSMTGPYLRVDEVSEGSELVGDFHLSLS